MTIGTDVDDADDQVAFDDHNSDNWEQNDDDSVKAAASTWVLGNPAWFNERLP